MLQQFQSGKLQKGIEYVHCSYVSCETQFREICPTGHNFLEVLKLSIICPSILSSSTACKGVLMDIKRSSTFQHGGYQMTSAIYKSFQWIVKSNELCTPTRGRQFQSFQNVEKLNFLKLSKILKSFKKITILNLPTHKKIKQCIARTFYFSTFSFNQLDFIASKLGGIVAHGPGLRLLGKLRLIIKLTCFVEALRAPPRLLRLPRKILICIIGTQSPKIVIKSKGFYLNSRLWASGPSALAPAPGGNDGVFY